MAFFNSPGTAGTLKFDHSLSAPFTGNISGLTPQNAVDLPDLGFISAYSGSAFVDIPDSVARQVQTVLVAQDFNAGSINGVKASILKAIKSITQTLPYGTSAAWQAVEKAIGKSSVASTNPSRATAEIALIDQLKSLALNQQVASIPTNDGRQQRIALANSESSSSQQSSLLWTAAKFHDTANLHESLVPTNNDTPLLYDGQSALFSQVMASFGTNDLSTAHDSLLPSHGGLHELATNDAQTLALTRPASSADTILAVPHHG
jgi:hypothetical protein